MPIRICQHNKPKVNAQVLFVLFFVSLGVLRTRVISLTCNFLMLYNLEEIAHLHNPCKNAKRVRIELEFYFIYLLYHPRKSILRSTLKIRKI